MKIPTWTSAHDMKENRNLKEYTMKKRILYNPLTDEFATLGDKFEKIAHNKVNGMYCYKRTTSDGLTYYEVFKAPKRVCKDGGKHECYPQTAEFGFGTALCIRGGEKYTADKIAFYMANGFEAGRFRA